MISEPLQISIDFQFRELADANISVFDRGFLFGDSVYEVLRTYDGKLFTFDEHFTRLVHSAESIYLKLPFSAAELKEHLQTMVDRLQIADCYLRIIVSRGSSPPNIEPPEKDQATTVVMGKPTPVWPKEYYNPGITLAVVGVRRNPTNALDPNIKSGNYLNNVIALYQAKAMHAEDAIMLNPSGEITESTTANIFFVRGETLFTPPIEAGILSGVSRQVILEIAEQERLSVEERQLTTDDLQSFDACFMTSTTREVMPVQKIIQQTQTIHYEQNAIVDKLIALYKNYIEKALAAA